MVNAKFLGGYPTYTFNNKETLKFVRNHKDMLMSRCSDDTGTKGAIGILAKTGNDSRILSTDLEYWAFKCGNLAFQDISRHIQAFILHFRVSGYHHLIFLLQ